MNNGETRFAHMALAGFAESDLGRFSTLEDRQLRDPTGGKTDDSEAAAFLAPGPILPRGQFQRKFVLADGVERSPDRGWKTVLLHVRCCTARCRHVCQTI